MVVVIFTRAGYEDMRQLVSSARPPVWMTGAVISELEIAELRGIGVDLTTFSLAIDPADPDGIEAALSIVAMHHPNGRLWVEIQAREL